MSKYEDLEKLSQLLEKNLISKKEFHEQKELLFKEPESLPVGDKEQSAYCVLALFLGLLGAHNFYAKRYIRASIQLLLTLIWITLIILFGRTAFYLLIAPIVGPASICYIWAIVEIFAIKTYGTGKALNPSPNTRLTCGILACVAIILVPVITSIALRVVEYATKVDTEYEEWPNLED